MTVGYLYKHGRISFSITAVFVLLLFSGLVLCCCVLLCVKCMSVNGASCICLAAVGT